MSLGTSHACEGKGSVPTMLGRHCDGNGILFERDATGYGHWVCEAHRGMFRGARVDDREADR